MVLRVFFQAAYTAVHIIFVLVHILENFQAAYTAVHADMLALLLDAVFQAAYTAVHESWKLNV